jgi:hypothetical protein
MEIDVAQRLVSAGVSLTDMFKADHGNR